MAFLRRFMSLIFWGGVVIACVAFIGYIAWPLMSDKFYSLCTSQKWDLCRGEWSRNASADVVQQTIEGRTISLFDLSRTAMSDVLTDRGGKTPVQYVLDAEIGVYMPQPLKQE